DGRVRSLRVALRALTRPSLIAPLRRLQQRVELCADRLSTWALDFVSDRQQLPARSATEASAAEPNPSIDVQGIA
ncbi:MAG: hypothetical protein AAF657_01715, partial [Acidobacteriota bacterium]